MYAAALEKAELPGVVFRACNFLPTFQKHAGCVCGGVQIHVTDREAFEPVRCGVALVKTAFDKYRKDFMWKQTAYEYVYDRNPFDVIAGTDKLRLMIEEGNSINEIAASWDDELDKFKRLRERYLLY